MAEKQMLIVRSVGFQQLDQSLPKLQEIFGDHDIALLTHQHGVKLAQKYETISRVYVYPYRQGFHYRRMATELSYKYDSVIIPVSNLSGNGFFNVLLYSLTIPAKRRYICNMVSEVWPVTPPQIFVMGLKHIVYTGISGALTGLFGLLMVLLLPLRLRRLLKNK